MGMGDPIELDEDLVAFIPIPITCLEDMEKVAGDMKTYAQSHPFDYTAKIKEACDSPRAEKEWHGPVLKARGLEPSVMQQWQKMVMLNNFDAPIHLTYTEGKMDGHEGIVQQLSIVQMQNMITQKRKPLDMNTIGCFASYFWGKDEEIWNSVSVVNNLPPHTAVLVRVDKG